MATDADGGATYYRCKVCLRRWREPAPVAVLICPRCGSARCEVAR